MAIQLTLLGLDRLGASLAQALSAQPNIEITGYDPQPHAVRLAQERKWIARAAGDALRAADGADLAVLSLPIVEQRDLLQLLGPQLRPGAVVVCLGPLLGPPLGWASLLPAGRHLVAAHPILHPEHLEPLKPGPEAARPDLFARGRWAVAAAPDCAPEALKAASDLAALAGAAPYFVDPVEHDGLMAAAEALPALLAAALMQATTAASGWSDLRQVAGLSYAAASAPLADAGPGALAFNPRASLPYLDMALAELQRLRQLLAADDGAALEALLSQAAALRERWLIERRLGPDDGQARPDIALPSASEQLGRMFVGGLLSRKRDG